MRLIQWFRTVGLFALLPCGTSVTALPIRPWPAMSSYARNFELDLRSNKELVTTIIPDASDNPTYKLICFVGNEDAVSQNDLLYSGGLMCGLGSVHDSIESILGNRSFLSDGQTSAMLSRGNFNPEEIVGYCSEYPDFGRKRDFFLRRMHIALVLSDIEVKARNNGVETFRAGFNNIDRHDFPIGKIRLSVSVIPDDYAIRPYAVPSKFRDPKGQQRKCHSLNR